MIAFVAWVLVGFNHHSFTAHLLARQEERMCVVGHSSFFEEMAGIKMDNVSVWRARLSLQGEWHDLVEVFQTPSLTT
jgi:hypothetical protein